MGVLGMVAAIDGSIARRVFAHRGMWTESGAVPNSLEAFRAAFENGLSVETDLRDSCGEVFISHDPILDSSKTPKLNDFLALASDYPHCALALNIKSDGLEASVSSVSNVANDYFFFDMSIPEALKYKRLNLAVATRTSELENLPSETEKTIWLDAFYTDPNKDIIYDVLRASPSDARVVLVSGELHKRAYVEFWNQIKAIFISDQRLAICTDFPLEFLNFVRSA
jgi:glycerophosphoryl diester phosphodiesterase